MPMLELTNKSLILYWSVFKAYTYNNKGETKSVTEEDEKYKQVIKIFSIKTLLTSGKEHFSANPLATVLILNYCSMNTALMAGLFYFSSTTWNTRNLR